MLGRLLVEYAAFWAVDRVCKYFVDKDYERRYQIWRSEFEILLLLIFGYTVWYRSVPWIFVICTTLTWIASVPNEGRKIILKGQLLLLGPVIKRAFLNTVRHYRELRDGNAEACENASLIERIVFSSVIFISRMKAQADIRGSLKRAWNYIHGVWRDTIDSYRNMEYEVPPQSSSFAATHKSVSFENTPPTVYTFSPPQMSSTPNNNTPVATPSATIGRRVSLRRQAKGQNYSVIKTP